MPEVAGAAHVCGCGVRVCGVCGKRCSPAALRACAQRSVSRVRRARQQHHCSSMTGARGETCYTHMFRRRQHNDEKGTHRAMRTALPSDCYMSMPRPCPAAPATVVLACAWCYAAVCALSRDVKARAEAVLPTGFADGDAEDGGGASPREALPHARGCACALPYARRSRQ